MATVIGSRTLLPYPPGHAWDLLADRHVIEGRTARHANQFHAQVVGLWLEHPVLRIETTGTVPTAWLPGWLAPHAEGRMPDVVRTELWRLVGADQLEGHMQFQIAGFDAASAGGWMRVHAGDRGSELRQELTIAVHLPLMGKLIERSLAVRIQQSLDAEAAHLAQL